MLSERMLQNPYPPSVGKFRPEQIAHRSTWTTVPDSDTQLASLYTIHIVPSGSTTVTTVNPTDPGDGWSLPPSSIPASRRHPKMTYG